MNERLIQKEIHNNGSASSGDGRPDGLPRMSEVLTAPAITSIHKDEAVTDYRDALRELGVPPKDVVRNSDKVEIKLAPLTNGDLRKALTPVYNATRAAGVYKARVNGNDNLNDETQEASSIEISE